MEFNVLDSLNSKLQRPEGSGPHDGLVVPFQLPPGVSNEARYVFTVQSIVMPQKLKGTLTFIVKNEESSTHEKLDFKLHFTCTSYLITTPCYSDAFAKLLESGDLKSSSVRLEGVNMPFHHLLARICFHHHFSVVERIDSCASMYSRSIQGHHVCLLVKSSGETVSIDAKCDEPTLLGNVLDEIKQTFSQCWLCQPLTSPHVCHFWIKTTWSCSTLQLAYLSRPQTHRFVSLGLLWLQCPTHWSTAHWACCQGSLCLRSALSIFPCFELSPLLPQLLTAPVSGCLTSMLFSCVPSFQQISLWLSCNVDSWTYTVDGLIVFTILTFIFWVCFVCFWLYFCLDAFVFPLPASVTLLAISVCSSVCLNVLWPSIFQNAHSKNSVHYLTVLKLYSYWEVFCGSEIKPKSTNSNTIEVWKHFLPFGKALDFMDHI